MGGVAGKRDWNHIPPACRTLPKVVATKRSRIHKRACEILRLEKDESDRVNIAISVCVNVSQYSIRSRSGAEMKGQRGSWANVEPSSGGFQFPIEDHLASRRPWVTRPHFHVDITVIRTSRRYEDAPWAS